MNRKISSLLLTAVLTLLLSACGQADSFERQAGGLERQAGGLERSEDPAAPEATPQSPEPEAPPVTQPETIPASLPAERSNQAGDHDSSANASRRYPPGGDRFSRGSFERPFNAETMDVYFPYLDIVNTQAFEDDAWVYASITLRGRDQAQSLPGQYMLEIDQDRDGRGDWLVVVTNPNSTDWSSQGVQVWQDSNNDVGGKAPFIADDNPPYSDGYELLVYDQGSGSKPDAAFARLADGDPHTVLLAVQKSLFEGETRLLVGMWAATHLDPALFDLNDHFTHEQAGAADPGLEYFYPIKALAELDNSCRIAIGFQPTGDEPGLCPVFIPKQPGEKKCQPPPGGCPWGWAGEPFCMCAPG